MTHVISIIYTYLFHTRFLHNVIFRYVTRVVTYVITQCYLMAVLLKLITLVVIATVPTLPVFRVFTATTLL